MGGVAEIEAFRAVAADVRRRVGAGEHGWTSKMRATVASDSPTGEISARIEPST